MYQKGERRREEILRATLRLIGGRGADAVTHRAVAVEADVPLAATTYYFASLGDLLQQALARVGEPYLDHARSVLATIEPGATAVDRLPELVVSIVAGAAGHDDHGRLTTFYERYVQAARDPRLQPLVGAWTDELIEMVGEALRRAGYRIDRSIAALAVATVDGLLLAALARHDDDLFATARAGVSRLLGLVRRSA